MEALEIDPLDGQTPAGRVLRHAGSPALPARRRRTGPPATETRAFLAERGVNLGGEQETKTRTALDYVSKKLRDKAREGVAARRRATDTDRASGRRDLMPGVAYAALASPSGMWRKTSASLGSRSRKTDVGRQNMPMVGAGPGR